MKKNKVDLMALLQQRIKSYLDANVYNTKHWHHGDYTTVSENAAKGQLYYCRDKDSAKYTVWCIKDDNGWYEITEGWNCYYHSDSISPTTQLELADFFQVLYQNGVALDTFLFVEDERIRQAAARAINKD